MVSYLCLLYFFYSVIKVIKVEQHRFINYKLLSILSQCRIILFVYLTSFRAGGRAAVTSIKMHHGSLNLHHFPSPELTDVTSEKKHCTSAPFPLMFCNYAILNPMSSFRDCLGGFSLNCICFLEMSSMI